MSQKCIITITDIGPEKCQAELCFDPPLDQETPMTPGIKTAMEFLKFMSQHEEIKTTNLSIHERKDPSN